MKETDRGILLSEENVHAVNVKSVGIISDTTTILIEQFYRGIIHEIF